MGKREGGGEGHLDKVREWEIYCYGQLSPSCWGTPGCCAEHASASPTREERSGSLIHWHPCGPRTTHGCKHSSLSVLLRVGCLLLQPKIQAKGNRCLWFDVSRYVSCESTTDMLGNVSKPWFSPGESGDYDSYSSRVLWRRKVHVGSAWHSALEVSTFLFLVDSP